MKKRSPQQVVFDSMRFVVRCTGETLDATVRAAKAAGYSEELAMKLVEPLRQDHHEACAGLNLVLETWEGELEKMSDTPKLADESKRLLDNGWRITLFKNDLGSYTARASKFVGHTDECDDDEAQTIITDDFEPSQALYRLTEKVYGNIV